MIMLCISIETEAIRNVNLIGGILSDT
jgi:hypothetical protein